MTTTANLGERVAHLEGSKEHLATEADLERMSSRLTWRMIIVAGIAQTLGVGVLLQFLPRP